MEERMRTVSRRALLGASYAAPTLMVVRPVAALAQSAPITVGPPTGPGPSGGGEPEIEVLPETVEPEETGGEQDEGPGGGGGSQPTTPEVDPDPIPEATATPQPTPTPSPQPTPTPTATPEAEVMSQGSGGTGPLPAGTAEAAQESGSLADTGIDVLTFLGLSAGTVAGGAAVVRASRDREDEGADDA